MFKVAKFMLAGKKIDFVSNIYDNIPNIISYFCTTRK